MKLRSKTLEILDSGLMSSNSDKKGSNEALSDEDSRENLTIDIKAVIPIYR